MTQPASTFGAIRAPLVDDKGMGSRDFIKWLQKIEAKADKALTLYGDIAAATKIEGRSEGIGTTVGKLTSAGKLTNADQIAADGSTYGRVVGTRLSSGKPFIDFSEAANLNKHLGNVADAPASGRAAWETATQKAAAVDSSGNLLLKNIAQANGTTASPTTASAVPAQVPELTATVTTKGNYVFLSFTVGFSNDTTGGSVFFKLYVDGVSTGEEYLGSSPIISQNETVAGSWMVHPSAASHSFAVYWWVTVGTTCTCNGTNRTLEVVELG